MFSGITLHYIIFSVVEIVGGGGGVFAPPPYFHFGAACPPPPPRPQHRRLCVRHGATHYDFVNNIINVRQTVVLAKEANKLQR